ncbi:MAG: hypothetical protein Q6362_002945 [Candidatus Wukongarchaeota archaeon]|nr:hypothetical protein [Candidatus Wukongarchaeota archaeon]
MEENKIVAIIKSRFEEIGNPAQISLLRGDGFFEAKMFDDGIYVDNLGTQPFLPWTVFTETFSLLKKEGGKAKKGNPMGPRLGEKALPFNSIEGHIAYTVYGKKEGDSVFRRTTPIVNILIWAGICKKKIGDLELLDCWGSNPQIVR